MPARRNTATKELRSIAVALRKLANAFEQFEPVLAVQGPVAIASKQTGRRKMKITPARRTALKLQGRYLGYMRQLKPSQKAKVKKIRAAKGIRAAIAVAKQLAA